MIFAVALALATPVAPAPFPEQVPALTEACIRAAIAAGDATEEAEAHKYMCGGEAAARFWAWLDQAGIASYEQDTGAEGVWLSREFPLGGCFKRLRLADGTATTTGLSCSVWVPRPAPPSASAPAPASTG